MADSRKSKLFKTYLSRMNTIKKDKFAAELFADFEAGKNSYMRIDRLESSNFDMTWIKAIENCIYDLGEIVANPKEVTKTVTGIVPVELARKTGAESVQHLASHTQYIKEITEEGDVVPNKILNIGSEEDIHTYENRFIATLIRRLVLFVEKRYAVVKDYAVLHDEEILYYKTKAIVDGSEVEIETKIKIKSESDSEAAITSNNYVARILKLREYIIYFYGSKFMKELKTERDVRNPIVMTNILRKNPKYHKCYELFRFIEKYDKLGVSYKLDEDASLFSDEELSELNTVMLTNYLALKGKDRSKKTKGFSRTYKPRILTSLDDEQFIYGDLLRGPIEFLRVDQGYQDFLDEQLKQDIPLHPTKIEKDYYAEELEERNTRKVEKAALDKLTKRKKKEQAEYEKQVRALVAQREKEEQERLAREADAARKEEERKIEEARQVLIRDALFGNDANPETEEGSSAPIEEPVVEEELPVEEEVVEEQPVEETPTEEVLEEPVQEESAPEQVEISEEQPQEEIQEAEEPIIEEPVEEIVNEELAEEEAPVEQPAESEQLSEEQVEELESPAEIEEELEGEQLGIIEEEPVQEEQPVEEEPQQEDIDAIRQQLIADALSEEAQEEEPQPEEVVEEAPVEEVPVEEPAPEEPAAEEPAPVEEEPHPEQPKPEKKFKVRFKRKDGTIVTIYDKGSKAEEAPAEEPVAEEPSVQEQPEEPKPAKRSKRRSPRKPKEQPVEQPVAEEAPIEEAAPEVEETPVVEEPVVEEPAPVEEPVQEEPVIEESEPEVVEEQPAEEIPENNEIPEENPTSAEKKPVHKKKEKKKSPPKPKEEPAKIPGRFIVKTAEGYYVNQRKWSIYKHEAYIFDDFNAANKVKAQFGGKVVKL